LQPIVNEAIARWAAAGLNTASLEAMREVQFVVVDLPGSYLGFGRRTPHGFLIMVGWTLSYQC
jgi:hypothetical protein